MVVPDMSSSDCLERALSGNRTYAKRTTLADPEFFPTLSQGQSPEILWIGCADSRVPETTVCDCAPGDIFVHRNIANCLHPNDLNASSVIEYATAFLKVKKIVVCGHTKCGGAVASLGNDDLGEILNMWLMPVRELRRQHQAELDKLASMDEKAVRLAELNVLRSVGTLKGNPTVKRAVAERGLTVHGAIYDISTGQLRLLETEPKPKVKNWGLWTPTPK